MSGFARPYARAFLDALPAGFDVEGFLESAAALARATANDHRLRNFFAAPSVPVETKRRALEDLARSVGVEEFGRRFLAVVLENRRWLALEEILSAVREARDSQLGVVEASVTVAAPVGDEERQRIQNALARHLGRRVRMNVRVDPTILAGFVARVGSEVFDASAVRAIELFHGEAAGAR
ncbi:MAG TPA: ATP synthase F1 subunit delta [Thermoanaerobaculia bacterium]|nr:ATP synthase F1 subunit delta [Thermoanaerobaculia bacterium]